MFAERDLDEGVREIHGIKLGSIGASCTRNRGFLAVAVRDDGTDFRVLDVAVLMVVVEVRDMFAGSSCSTSGLE